MAWPGEAFSGLDAGKNRKNGHHAQLTDLDTGALSCNFVESAKGSLTKEDKRKEGILTTAPPILFLGLFLGTR